MRTSKFRYSAGRESGNGSKGFQLSIKDDLATVKSGDSVQLTVTFDGSALAASDIMWKINDNTNIVGAGSYVDADNVFHAGRTETRDDLTIKAIYKSKNLSAEKTLTHIKYRDVFGDAFTLTNKGTFPGLSIADADKAGWTFSFDGTSIIGRNGDEVKEWSDLRIGDIADCFIEVPTKQFSGSWAFLFQGDVKIGVIHYAHANYGYTGVTKKPCYWANVYLGKTEMSYPLIAYANYSDTKTAAEIADASIEFKAVLRGAIKEY